MGKKQPPPDIRVIVSTESERIRVTCNGVEVCNSWPFTVGEELKPLRLAREQAFITACKFSNCTISEHWL